MYDVTNRNSFKNISMWSRAVHEHAPAHVSKILVGNKCDMLDRVRNSEIKAYWFLSAFLSKMAKLLLTKKKWNSTKLPPKKISA